MAFPYYNFEHLQRCQMKRVRPKRRSWIRCCASTLVRLPINAIPFSPLSDPLHWGVDWIRDTVILRNTNRQAYEECTEEEFRRLSRREQEQCLLHQKAKATSHREFHKACEDLDVLQGFGRWKAELDPDEFEERCGYDPLVLDAERLKLEDAIAADQVSAVLEFFEERFSRDIAGINHPQLYAHSHHGTKSLIEEYTATVMAALSLIKTRAPLEESPGVGIHECLDVLQTALKHCGRTALTLSGGATMGMKHIGVVKALIEADLLPQIISGTSAGSIVAAVVGCTPDEELPKVLERFADGDLAVFSERDASLATRCYDAILSFCHRGALFDERHLTRVMKIWLKDMTFAQAYNLTGRKLCIGISADNGKKPRLLTYLNAPNVIVWSAVCATCAVPTVFAPAIIYERCPITGNTKEWKEPDSDSKWIDGSVDADIPKEELTAIYGVKNFIVSQVNPHVRLFTGGEKEFTGEGKIAFEEQPRNLREASLNQLRALIVGQTPPGWTSPQPEEWQLVRMIKSILRQEYWGDINILPDIQLYELAEVFANPTPEFMYRAVHSGEKATWRHLNRIRNSYAIELALVRTIRELRSHAHFGTSVGHIRALDQKAGQTERPGSFGSFSRRRAYSLEHESPSTTEDDLPKGRRHIRRRTSSVLNRTSGITVAKTLSSHRTP